MICHNSSRGFRFDEMSVEETSKLESQSGEREKKGDSFCHRFFSGDGFEFELMNGNTYIERAPAG
jgi:hypothetical protein